jgi:hypothetical protein
MRSINNVLSSASIHLSVPQSWPTTGLKPDGGTECAGIFRSQAAFDVDNALEVSFRCQHSPWVVPIRFCVISKRPASRDPPAPRYFNYNWLGLKFQLVYRADLRKRRKSHGTRYTLRPPSRHDDCKAFPTTSSDVFRCISAADPSGALDVILNSDRHVFYLI